MTRDRSFATFVIGSFLLCIPLQFYWLVPAARAAVVLVGFAALLRERAPAPAPAVAAARSA